MFKLKNSPFINLSCSFCGIGSGLGEGPLDVAGLSVVEK